MAEGRSRPRRGKGAALAPELVLDEPLSAGAPDDLPFPMQLPPAMFSGPGLLTLADLLPVMTAFVDRDLVYRFMNKPLGEWLGRARRDMIGRTMCRRSWARRPSPSVRRWWRPRCAASACSSPPPSSTPSADPGGAE